MSSTPSSRSRFREFNDLGSKRGSSHISNRHSSYIPPSQPLDVLSLLTPSAKSKYASGSSSVSKTADVPSRRISSSSSVTRTVYSVKTSDGSEVKTDAPVKKNVFGRSSIYGALEAALGTVEDSHNQKNMHHSKKNVDELFRKTVADEKSSDGQVVYRRRLPQSFDKKPGTHEAKQERQKSVSLDVEEAFPSLRSRIQSFDSLKAKATKRVLPHTPHEEEPKLTIRRVSFEHVAKPESVCLKKDSDDSGCDEYFEDSQAGTPTPSHRVASITSIDSLLGPGSPRTSSTSPDLIPRKLSGLVSNPTLEECKENVFSDTDMTNGKVKKGVDLDDSIEFVTVEAPVQLMPLKKNPPKLMSDEGVFERKFFTNEKILEKKISNTKLLSNDSSHVESKQLVKNDTTNKKVHNLESKSKVNPSVSDETSESFKDSCVKEGPFDSDESRLVKFINNTKKTNNTAPIPIRGNETSDRNSFFHSEKIVEKKVRNTKPVSENNTMNLFAESQKDRIGERFTANEKIMNKLISNTRKTESVQSLPDKQLSRINESNSSDKACSDEGKKKTHDSNTTDRNVADDKDSQDDTNSLQKTIESKKLNGSFSVNDKSFKKFVTNTKPPQPVETKAEAVEPACLNFSVNEKILNRYITNTKKVEISAPPASKNKEDFQTVKNEEQTVKQVEKFTVNDKILNKYVKNTKPSKAASQNEEDIQTVKTEEQTVKQVEKFTVNDQILNKYVKNTKPPKALLEQLEDVPSKIPSSTKENDGDGFNREFQTGDRIFERLLNKSKQWESSPALLNTESTSALDTTENFNVNENLLDKFVKNTKPPKTVSTSPENDKTSAKYKEWEEAEVAKDPLSLSFRRKTPPSDFGDNSKARKIKKPPIPSDDTSPVTPLSPLVAKMEVLATSPVSSSDESDVDWKKKIMSSQNLLQRGVSAPTLLRPLVATIMEGISDVSDTEDVLGDLPSFKPSGQKAKFGRQYSTPVQSPRKEQSVPLQPARRRKSHVKTRRKSQQKQPPPKPQTVELEENFDSLDDFTSPVLQSPFKNAIRPNRRTTTSQNPVRLRQELEKQRKEQEEKENVLKKRAEPKNPGAVSHWKKARLAASAINGLQMKIDFASAARGLRKTEKRADGTAKVSKAAGEESCVESKFPEKMLLLLKGRKNVQCALVECKVSSLNSGDVFLLLHKDELFHFVGQDANVHEKAKGNDLVERIIRNKEMGCTATKCTSLLEKDMDMCNRSFKRFFELLGGRPPIAEKESVIEDKEFERRFQQEARVSVYEDDETTPSFVELNTGKRLKYDILDCNKTFVLDFITEYYIWCGKGVPLSVRKKALQLAEEEYKKSVAECPKNPIVPPQGRRASVAMTAGALPTTEVSRRISCASRGSIDMPNSVKLARRTSTSSIKNQLTQRSISSDNVNSGRRVSVSVNSRGSFSKVNSDTNLRRMSSTSTSSGERRQSVASQSGRRMSTASRRSSVVSNVSNGRGSSSSRRASLMSTCSVDSSGQMQGRRVSVSMKQLRSLVTGSGKRIQTEQGALQVERADWGINTVTIQGKEPISLREKFSDWPEPGRIIKMKGHAASDEQNKSLLAPSQPLEPYNAELMHRPQPAEEVLKLELTKLGRGRGTFKSFDEEITVVTDDVKTWLVHEYKNYVLPSSYQQ
ncbi:hypothetical protein ACHWQZ_G016940 [Mnemiopsis leidyi]